MTTVVVGDGIAGCTVALALRRRGSAVTLVGGLERPGVATPASAGMVAPQYESDLTDPTFRLGVESRARYPDFLAALSALVPAELELVNGGMLVANLTPSEREAATSTAGEHRRAGLEADVLDAAAARAIEPTVGADIESFLWLPREARLDPRRLAMSLHRALDAVKVRRVSGRATAVVRENDVVSGVRLEDGDRVSGSGVVIAAGAWSADIGGLPYRLPLRPVRGQMIRLASAGLPTGPVLADHAGRYLVPAAGGALAGSTMEDAGFVAGVTDDGLQSIRMAVGRLCPTAARAAAADRWCGLRPLSEDGMPIIGPEPLIPDVFYATGYGRSGVLLAPLLAEAVADLVLGSEPDIEWRELSVERFRRN